MVTPCWLTPISAPQIQKGLASSTAKVCAAWSISMVVQRTRSPGAWSAAGRKTISCASLGSRSEFLAKRAMASAEAVEVTVRVSHMGGILAMGGLRWLHCTRRLTNAPARRQRFVAPSLPWGRRSQSGLGIEELASCV